MSTKFYKTYIRRVRTEMGRFPSYPLQMEVALGDLFYYHGRRGRYERQGNLADLGIHVTPTGSQVIIEEQLDCKSPVGMTLGLNMGLAAATFSFGRKSAMATSVFGQSYKSLPPKALIEAIKAKVTQDPNSWKSWLIVTELWSAEGYTLMLSGEGGADATIKSGVDIPFEAFHVANPQLKLSVTKKRNMHYMAIAKAGVHPFFQLSTVVRTFNGLKVRPYAQR